MSTEAHPANIIVQEYSFDRIAALSKFEKGYVNETWLAESGGKRYLLKKFASEFSPERIRFMIASQEHLGLLTARIVKTRENGSFVIREGSSWLLTEFIPSNSLDPAEVSPDTLVALGSFLGRIHKRYETFQTYPGDPYFFQLSSNPGPKLESLIRKHANLGTDRFYSESLNFKLKQLDRFDYRKVSQFESLPRQVLHGDFYLGNILKPLHSNDLKIVDFDQSSIFFKGYEIMRGFTHIFFSLPRYESITEHLSLFLSGYLEECSLSPEERELLPDLYIWFMLSEHSSFDPTPWSSSRLNALKEFAALKMRILQQLIENKAAIIDRILPM